jgi:hypothetical protein
VGIGRFLAAFFVVFSTGILLGSST